MPISDLLPWNRDKEKYAIQRRDEFDSLDTQHQMNRMMDNFFDTPFGFGPFRRMFDMEDNFIPRMDVSESDQEVRITTDLPGLDEKDIHLTIENNRLTVSGEKKAETEEKDRTYHRVERHYGSFSRIIDLPEGVDPDKIEASFKKGVLEIIIPKPAESVSQKKRIPIKAG
jgi:HSP20 family protein